MKMRRCAAICGLVAGILAAPALAAPYAYGDIRLGADVADLARRLDLRDIEGALREAQAHHAGKPDLGRRGYGCLRREDPYADMTCVSHDETFDGTPTREIRLQFLGGVLQQFSVTAELQYADAVIETLRRRYGAPRTDPAANGTGPTWHWHDAESKITAYRGKNLVFVSFELNSYRDAVARKQQRGAAPECH